MDYYLYIEPYSLFFRKKGQCLFYNTLNKKVLKVNFPNNASAMEDCLETDKYVVLNTDECGKEDMRFFVDQLRQTFNGDLLPAPLGSVPPAIFAPCINNQREFEKLNNYEWMEKDGQVMNYIEEIYLYLNGHKSEKDDGVWKQLPSYLCSDRHMDSGDLMSWMKDCLDQHISRINLLGGDVLMYPDWKKVVDVLQQKSMSIQVYYRYDLFTEAHRQLLGEEAIILTLVVPVWRVDENCFSILMDIVSRLEQKKQFLFLVMSEKDFELADELIEKYELESPMIKPVYRADNLDFFEQTVYLDESDIQNISAEKRDFYVAQKINRNDFGRLTVLPDGKIFANVNYPAIGELRKDRMASVLYKEMTEGCSWLRVRNQKPCCDCIYQWLCPSPSNYELVIGKSNLCHVGP